MHLYNVVLFFILFYFNVAQIFLPLNPQIVVFMKNATSEYMRNNAVSFDVFPNALSASGVGSNYYFTTQSNPTCTGPTLNKLSVPNNFCFKNYIGTPPNCSVLRTCLLNNPGSIERFSDCMVPPVYIYITVEPLNITSYLVRFYVDDACTVIFPFFETLAVPFGCQPAQQYDENGNFCGVTNYIFPLEGTAFDNTPWVITGTVISIFMASLVIAIFMYVWFNI